jgi:sarcosine oxidase subunit alpha
MRTRKSGPYRLAHGGIIRRNVSVVFKFNGKTYSGYAGDSLASAMLAIGIRTLARSFKFHRPRGVFSCGVEEPCGLLQVGEGARTIPSVRAPLLELTPDIHARSHSGWPSVNFDLGRSLDLVAPLWAAGFYNKTFIWPRWHTYEPLIRRLAGLGRAPKERDPERYEVCNWHCDVLVIGGGVAGLRAACEAISSGARVLLVEQDSQFGGEATWSGAMIDGAPASSWVTQRLRDLSRLPEVRLLTRTTATG